MKVRQRWRPEEDALLRSYVKQYGPRDWNLVSQRMNVTFTRDAKSCLERWKNYLKPGIKKGSLTEEEQQLVIHLQAKHGNKWKKIAAEVPGRTAKRLGKWWEVFKEKQQRELESSKSVEPIEEGKYNHILQSFAEKLVEQGNLLAGIAIPMPIPANSDQPVAPAVLPLWLASSSSSSIITNVRPPSPSVTLSLSPLTVPQAPGIPWLQGDKATMDSTSHNMITSLPSIGVINPLAMNNNNNPLISEIIECCREMEEGHRAWTAHRKEAAWRLKRVELQLESEKATKRKEKMEEIEAKINALREEQKASLDWIEAEYREQLMGLRREAEAKEQKLAEQWSVKHLRLMKFLEQMGTGGIASEANGR